MSREALGGSFFYSGSVFAKEAPDLEGSELEPRRVYEVEGSELEARAGSYDYAEGSEIAAWDDEEGSQLWEGSEIAGSELEESEIAERPWLLERMKNWGYEESEIASQIAERQAPPPVQHMPISARAPMQVNGHFQPKINGYAQPHMNGYTQPPKPPPKKPYQPFPQDLIDLHVADYFRKHPEVHAAIPILRRGAGLYELNGRFIRVELQFIRDQGGQQKALLTVVDGPLRQPFADYMEHKDATETYSGSVFMAKNSLQAIPQSARMTFQDNNNGYTRVEAMKVAKEQAAVRESAARMMSQGQVVVPDEMKARYQRTISMKLGSSQKHVFMPMSGR